MREILFRGKRVDNGEWVEGYFLVSQKADKTWYIVADILSSQLLPIIPETLGQFTGILDKNKNRIFESDVLKLTYDGHSFNCEVKYSDGGFLVYENNGFNSGDADMTLIGWLKHDDYRYEVIGNVHDSPNLLK